MAINYNPFSQFNVEPSSFSLPAGMDMNQAATMNPMMQPVSLLGQQGFGAPQQAPLPEEEEEGLFEGNLLSGLASLGAAVNKSKSPPVTYRNYDFPEPSRASALSVFTQGGDLKPGIDVNAITPSPQASPSLYAINTALNQEVPFEPLSQGPGYFQRLSEFSEPVFNRDQGLFDVNRLGSAADDLLGSAMRNLTPVEDRRFANNEPFGKTFTDTFAITRPDGTKFYPDEINQPAGIPMGPQTQESISPFLQSPDTPSGLGGPLLDGFNRVNDSFREPNAPMGRDATKARIAELFGLDAPATLNQAMLNDPDAVIGTDAQGRMRSFESPEALQQNLFNAQSAFDLASLDRLARLEQRDVRPSETLQERDTRIADSRTEGTDRGGEMTFEEARKFVPKGAKEKTKDYNERIKAFQAQQNSVINKLKEQYEQYRVSGQGINNERLEALASQYQQTEPQKYREAVQVAQEMLRDGVLQDELQAAMYVVDIMGGKVSDIFETDAPNGSTNKTDGSTSPMIDQVIQSGQGGSPSSGIQLGQVVEQGGKKYRFDGVNYNEI